MMSYKIITKAWDKFFFEPKPVDSLALFRILWFLNVFIMAIIDFSNINDFYGPHALVSLGTVKAQFAFPHVNIFHFFNSSYGFVQSLFVVYVLAIISSIVGYYTKTSIFIVLVCMTSFHQRNIWLLSSSELLMRIITLYLVFSPCGHAFSVDSIKGKVKEWSPWVLRIIQIQLSVIYVWTVWHKLKGDTWFDGTALYYATRLESMKNFTVPFLLDWMPFLKFATWMTLIIELALGILIWFKEFRRPLIILGILFHLGIEYMMSIPFFEINMILLLLLFIPPEEVRSFIEEKSLLWDGHALRSNFSEKST